MHRKVRTADLITVHEDSQVGAAIELDIEMTETEQNVQISSDFVHLERFPTNFWESRIVIGYFGNFQLMRRILGQSNQNFNFEAFFEHRKTRVVPLGNLRRF
jgi:hypothetical protein